MNSIDAAGAEGAAGAAAAILLTSARWHRISIGALVRSNGRRWQGKGNTRQQGTERSTGAARRPSAKGKKTPASACPSRLARSAAPCALRVRCRGRPAPGALRRAALRLPLCRRSVAVDASCASRRAVAAASALRAAPVAAAAFAAARAPRSLPLPGLLVAALPAAAASGCPVCFARCRSLRTPSASLVLALVATLAASVAGCCLSFRRRARASPCALDGGARCFGRVGGVLRSVGAAARPLPPARLRLPPSPVGRWRAPYAVF